MAALPDITTLSAIGGTKTDYSPVEDSTTDVAATEWNTIANNVAGLSYTCPRAWRRFTTANTSAPTDPGSNSHGAVWGNDPSVKPTVARTATGTYTVTWTATQNDLLGTSHTLALFTGWGNAESGSTQLVVQVVLTSANVATVYVRTNTGSLTDTTGVTIAVWVM